MEEARGEDVKAPLQDCRLKSVGGTLGALVTAAQPAAYRPRMPSARHRCATACRGRPPRKYHGQVLGGPRSSELAGGGLFAPILTKVRWPRIAKRGLYARHDRQGGPGGDNSIWTDSGDRPAKKEWRRFTAIRLRRSSQFRADR